VIVEANFSTLVEGAFVSANYAWNWNAGLKLIQGCLSLGLGLFVFSKNPKSIINRVYFCFTFCVFLWLIGLGMACSTWNPALHIAYNRWITHFGVVLIGPFVMWFSAEMTGTFQKHRNLIFLNFIIAGIFFSLFQLFPAIFHSESVNIYSWGVYIDIRHTLYSLFYIPFIYQMFWSLYAFRLKYQETNSPILRNRIKHIFAAFVVIYLGSIDWLPCFGVDLLPLGHFFAFGFDLIMAYTILSDKMFDIETIFLRTAVWIVSGLVLFAPIGFFIPAVLPFLPALIVFLPVSRWLYQQIENIIEGRRLQLNAAFLKIVDELSVFSMQEKIISYIQNQSRSLVGAESVAVFVNDNNGVAQCMTANDSNSPLAINAAHPLMEKLKATRTLVVADQAHAIDNSLLYFPLIAADNLIGFIGLGPKSITGYYKQAEVDFYVNFCRVIAVALKNSILFKQSLEVGRLKEINQAKSMFVSMVSHEFRTPLTLIQAAVHRISTLGAKLGTDQFDHYWKMVDRESLRMGKLVDDVINVTKLDVGAFAINPATGILDHVIYEVVNEFETRQLSQRIFAIVSNNDIEFNFDRERIKQVLINLLSNAIKYSPPNGIITMLLNATSNDIMVTVEDEGQGIPPELHTEVFEQFSSISHFEYKRLPGTGLGLSICKRIVELHGGKIWLESPAKDGAGTRFCFTLPRKFVAFSQAA
jgi:signal transduction histidine kinase